MKKQKRSKGVYILNLEAKDVYSSNHMLNGKNGYEIRNDNGVYLRKFKGKLDDSLELRRLREAYYDCKHNRKFSFIENGKEYSTEVVTVNFNYSYKEYNKETRMDYSNPKPIKKIYWVKAGYKLRDLELNDCVAMDNNEVVAVQVDAEIATPSTYVQDPLYYDDETNTYQMYENHNKPLMTRKDLRDDLYVNGFDCDGKHYVRYKRSSGASRVGKCMFINEDLYQRMHTWEKCDIRLQPETKLDLAGWEAYIALTTSTIIDTIDLAPENILLIDDYDSTFTDKMLAVEQTGTNGQDLVGTIKETEITNCIFDGQSLLESECFGKYSHYGMLLLRSRLFKSACFNTNIQQFFRDHGITDVSQLNGQTRAKRLEDIKLITTPSSVKFMKFGTFDQWLDSIAKERKKRVPFGIVKHEKPTKFFGGKMVQTHYQLLNTLHMSPEEMDEFLAPSHDYYMQVASDPRVFRLHVKAASHSWPENDDDLLKTISSTNNFSYYMLSHNAAYGKTDLYHKWKGRVLKSIKSNLKCGHVLVEGTYGTLFSNPYEMLLSAIGRFDGESVLGQGNVYCKRFEDGAELLGSRSPHVAAGNILLATNRRCERIDTYFNLSPEIVCINSIKENILERLSGADMDSDTMLLTTNPLLIKYAKRHYNDFAVPTKLVPATPIKRTLTPENLSDLDNVTADNQIGAICNLAQQLNSCMWDKLNNGASFEDVADMYADIGCLDVLSNIEIDRAKRECSVKADVVMNRIRDKYHPTKSLFFKHIDELKNLRNDDCEYKPLKTSMDYLNQSVTKWRAKRVRSYEKIPIADLFVFPHYKEDWVNHEKGEKALELILNLDKEIYSLTATAKRHEALYNEHIWDDYRDNVTLAVEQTQTELIKLKLASVTTEWLVKQAFKDENKPSMHMFFKLFILTPELGFGKYLRRMERPVPSLVPSDEEADVTLYGMHFKEVC